MDKILLSELVKGIADVKEDCYITSVVTDSRRACKNSVFIAIVGERVNGEKYAKSALENGCEFVITEHKIDDIPADKQAVVPSVLDASVQMGANFRKNYDIKIIGVTGSVGKTTTKEFIYRAISPFAKTVKSEGNRNNELGMPKTMYGFSHDDEIGILEMGMEAVGDVHKLSLRAKPVAAVITGIGISHLERLGSRENILKAKLEICDGMSDDGILVLNGDDDFLPYADIKKPKTKVFFAIENKDADVTAENIRLDGRKTLFTIKDKLYGEFECEIPTVGAHNVMNAISAYALVTRMGYDAKKTAENLSGYKVSGWRQNFVDKGGITFIEDCYNASPDSERAAVNTLVSVAKGRKICAFGDMMELGSAEKELHRQMGEYARAKGVDCMWTYGDLAQNTAEGFGEGAVHFTDRQAYTDFIKKNLKVGDTIVFKASHSRRFEDILADIYKETDKQ